jgi:hypothetical protein
VEIQRGKPSPFEVMFMVAALVGGLALLVLRQHLGSSLAQALPPIITILLGAGLWLGGLITLIGMSLHVVLGPLLERAGLALLALLLLAYSGFTIDFVGVRGLITSVFFVSFASAGLWRIRQIGTELHRLEVDIKEAVDRHDGEVSA